jgi:hypothetical protein
MLQLARHLIFGRSRLTIKSDKDGAEAVFLPVITSSYTPLLDIDYNVHKSNSTFFVDLDGNRTELMLALFKDVLSPRGRGKKAKTMNLGGTSCTFKKAIPTFGCYEVSSRVLCWDQKWIYVVSHFTRPGWNQPTRFLVGSQEAAGKMPKAASREARKENIAQAAPAEEDQRDGIYASAIAKYVFKAGRVTLSPRTVLEECGLLPPPEDGIAKGAKDGSQSHWSRVEVQEECQKNLELAHNFAELDQLHGTFVGRSGPALYTY